MSKFVDDMIEKAKKGFKTIVLPEGEDDRVIEAAGTVVKEKIAKVILLGDSEVINAKMQAKGISSTDIEVINPVTSDKLQKYADLFYDLRKFESSKLKVPFHTSSTPFKSLP